MATNGQILVISEFSQHIHYDFLKEDHKSSFPKIYSGVWKIKFDQKIFWMSSKSYRDTTSCKKIRKKYRTVKAVGPERTDGRTNGSEFIGSFRSLKTSGEPNRSYQNYILFFRAITSWIINQPLNNLYVE